MSRSYRHTPIGGYTCAVSEKKWKRSENRRYRHKVKNEINQEKEILSLFREVSEEWTGPKDGKNRHFNKRNWFTNNDGDFEFHYMNRDGLKIYITEWYKIMGK